MVNLKKIVTVVGARPQFIKLAALLPQLKQYFEVVVIHTGQHYDQNLSDNFFTELSLPKPNYNLEAKADTALLQIADIIIKIEPILIQEKPHCVIVFGDTNSTAAASIAASKLNIPIGHVEAGLREFDKTIPEETNKLITDILTDFYFCPSKTGVNILKSMGITKNVFNVGDVMIDILFSNMSKIKNNLSLLEKLNIEKEKYIFLTCHRAANTDFKQPLTEILSTLSEFKMKVVFAIHPRTKNAIQKFNLNHFLELENIIVCQPLGYIDTQTLIHYAKFIVTDSGGVTKETYYHKTPGILIDKQTEWIETIEEGWNIQAGPNKNKIIEAAKGLKKPKIHSSFSGHGDASKKIADILKTLLY